MQTVEKIEGKEQHQTTGDEEGAAGESALDALDPDRHQEAAELSAKALEAKRIAEGKEMVDRWYGDMDHGGGFR